MASESSDSAESSTITFDSSNEDTDEALTPSNSGKSAGKLPPAEKKKRGQTIGLKAKMALLCPQAVQESWTAKKLAEEAGCHRDTAAKYYQAYVGQIQQAEANGFDNLSRKLKQLALESTDKLANRLALLDRLALTAGLTLEEKAKLGEMDMKDLAALMGSEERLLKITRQLTGIDVAEKKAIAEAGKTQIQMNWMGTESLDLSEVIDLSEV